MQPRIHLTFAAALLIGGAALLAHRSAPLLPVKVRNAKGGALQDTLATHQEYYLGVEDSLRRFTDSLWFWTVEHDGKLAHQYLGMRDPAFTVTEPGTYVATAFHAMHRVAQGTLVVGEGTHLAVNWPGQQAEIGQPIQFQDRSTGVEERRWTLLSGTDTLDQRTEPDFSWTGEQAGTYQVELFLKLRTGRDTVLRYQLALAPKPVPPVHKSEPPVHKSEPPVRKSEPPVRKSEPPVRKSESLVRKSESLERKSAPPERKPDPPPPPPMPPAPKPAAKTGDCFPRPGADFARAAKVTVPVAAPDREGVQGNSATTVIEVVPDKDCQLASFKFWGLSDVPSNPKVTIECMEQQCKGNPKSQTPLIVMDDDNNPQEFNNSRMPVLQAGYRYRITIDPGGAKLGFFPLGKTEHAANGILLHFLSQQSAAFNFTFRVKQ